MDREDVALLSTYNVLLIFFIIYFILFIFIHIGILKIIDHVCFILCDSVSFCVALFHSVWLCFILCDSVSFCVALFHPFLFIIKQVCFILWLCFTAYCLF
jgi:hypothetical protein